MLFWWNPILIVGIFVVSVVISIPLLLLRDKSPNISFIISAIEIAAFFYYKMGLFFIILIIKFSTQRTVGVFRAFFKFFVLNAINEV